MVEKKYWDSRGNIEYKYKGEYFYTITPIPIYYERRSKLISLMKPYLELHNDSLVCDFGCGDGAYIFYLAIIYKNLCCYGFDISKIMINKAKKNVHLLCLLFGAMEYLLSKNLM